MAKRSSPRRFPTHRSCGIAVRGGAEFQRRTKEALALLRPLPEFALIRAHLGTLYQSRRSGMRPWSRRPAFAVGAPTWSHSALWYAGTIAHDAYHAKLYQDAKRADPAAEPRADAWTGKAAERACLAFQSRVLAALGAAPWILDYLRSQRRDPAYQGRSQGRQGWLDYRRRWW